MARRSLTAPDFDIAPIHGVQNFSASGTISLAGGKLCYFSGAAGQTITVPAAAAGREFDLLVTDTADSVTVARSGADVFYLGSANGAAVTSFVLKPGQRARIVALVAGRWEIIISEAHDASAAAKFEVSPVHAAQAFAASGTISATGGKRVTWTGTAGQTLTLPNAPPAGTEFEITNLHASNHCFIARNGAGSNLIYLPGNNSAGLTSIPVPALSSVKIVYTSANVWSVIFPERNQSPKLLSATQSSLFSTALAWHTLCSLTITPGTWLLQAFYGSDRVWHSGAGYVAARFLHVIMNGSGGELCPRTVDTIVAENEQQNEGSGQHQSVLYTVTADTVVSAMGYYQWSNSGGGANFASGFRWDSGSLGTPAVLYAWRL